jgi:ketosteroid isomerase-like protein
MKSIHALLATLLVASLSAHAGSPRVVGDPKRAEEIQQLFDSWIAAQNARNLDEVMAVFDKNVVLSLQGEADKNYDEIVAGFKREFSWAAKGTWSVTLEEIYADKKLTVAVSRWELRIDNAAGAGTLVATIRSVDTLSKSPDGWKIVRTINYPVIAPAPS